MTQRIAEADGGRVWMEWDETSDRYHIYGSNGAFMTYWHNWRFGWCMYNEGKLILFEDEEADAVCLLWSKV
jgi:hypothetical protein